MSVAGILEVTELWGRPIGRVLRAASWLTLYIAATGDHIAGKVFVGLLVLRTVGAQLYCHKLRKLRKRRREMQRVKALEYERVASLESEMHKAVYGVDQER